MPLIFTQQFDQMDCGPACIRMIASYYGKKYSLPYLRTLSHLTREGVSVLGICTAFKEIGMNSSSFEMTLEQIKEICPLPAILHWEQNHFVVLTKIHRSKWTKKWLYDIANPAYGKHTFDEDSFSNFWLNKNTGVVIAVEPTTHFYEKQNIEESHSFVRFAWKYVWPFRLELLQSVVGLFLGLILSLIMPLLTQIMVDEGIGLRDTHIIVSILWAQLFIFCGTFSMELINNWVSLYMSTIININILNDYLTKLLCLPMSFFETKSIGDCQQRLEDHERLQGFVTYSTLYTFFSIISAPFYLAIIGWYSIVVLLTYLLLTTLSTGWMIYFFQRRKSLDYEQFRISVVNQNKQYELLSGIIDIKLNNYEKYKLEEWVSLQKRQYQTSQKVLRLEQIQNTGFALIGQIRNIFITSWIAMEVVNGNLTLGMMMSISAIIGQVNEPLSQLIGFLQEYQDAKISLERSEEVHLCANEDNEDQISLLNEIPQDIEIKNLSFSYSGNLKHLALSDINIKIPSGKMTAIVGESGSGKTTLLKLLLKFYEPSKGEIRIGRESLKNITAKSIRQSSGIVMQENLIFSDTLRQNIILGEPEDEERLSTAITLSCLDDYVEKQPLGLYTKIGTEGNGVSGGEKQRIKIARAIYKNPLYLMLDEATSSLDAENEHLITEGIAHHFQGKTRIVIAHRLSTVRNADNIIVLRKGKVVENGTHEQLIALRGFYYKLIQNQLELADGK